MPESRHHHATVTASSASDVWRRLQNPETWATVATVDQTSDHDVRDGNLVGFKFTVRLAAMFYRGTAEVTRATPDQEMTLSIRSNELLGEVTIKLSSRETATGLDVMMTMRPAGIMGSMVFPIVSAAVSGGFADSVERLAEDLAS